jgi:tetratricopeptide (TPR) repeat protein
MVPIVPAMTLRSIVFAALYLGLPLCAAVHPNENSVILSIQDLISRGELDAANGKISEALQSDPRSGGLFNLRGIVDIQQGRAADAEADFSKAIDLSPGLVSAYLNLGRVYQSRIDSDAAFEPKAIAIYQRALKLEPHSAEAHYQLALLLEWRGSFADSLTHLTALSAEQQKQARVLALECANLSGLKRADQARRKAQHLVSAPDLQEQDVLGILPVLERGGNAQITVTLIEGLSTRGLASTESLAHLGAAYEKLGQLAQARHTLEHVAQAQPQNSKPLIDLARVAYRAGDREGALGYLAHARDLDPRNATIHFVFGIIALELKLPLEAKASLTKALELEPDRPDYNYGMAIVSLHGHDTSESIPYFKKFLATGGDDARGHYGLGIAYFYGGNYEEAKKEMLIASASPKTRAGAHYFLGRIARTEGDAQEAESQIRQSISQDPSYADAHAELALILIHQRRFPEAQQELDRALQLDPENFSGNTNQLVLYQRTKDGRAAAQSEKLHKLEKKRDEMQELLYRRIEVRPY